MTDLRGATVLITGAAGGFGQELNRQLHARGARLILTDLTPPDAPDSLQTILADLATPEGCADLIDALDHPVDILINNAGVGLYGRFDETPQPAWERLMQVNLLAALRLTYALLPAMIERGHGHIVTISSLAGWVATPGLAAYAASKYALRGFGEALGREVGPHGIRVTTVYPFYSRTPILDSPQHGSLAGNTPPASQISDPADVIREVVEAIERDQTAVFPDRTAKTMHLIKRFAPRLVPWLEDRMTDAD